MIIKLKHDFGGSSRSKTPRFGIKSIMNSNSGLEQYIVL